MAITLYQINGGQVPPIADALLYDFLGGSPIGIVAGCEVTSLGGNQLQIASGWGMVYGRVFSVEQEIINATVSTSGTANGRLLINIDIANTEQPVTFITQAAATLPELTQEQLNGAGTIFQLPLATYEVDKLAVSSLASVAPVAIANSGIRQQADKANAALGGCWIEFTDEEGNPTEEPYIHWMQEA